jgi:hypothetical protein
LLQTPISIPFFCPNILPSTVFLRYLVIMAMNLTRQIVVWYNLYALSRRLDSCDAALIGRTFIVFCGVTAHLGPRPPYC